MELLQAILNGIMAGTLLAVPAIGFTTIFAVLRFPNFAIGGIMAIGAYSGLVANTIMGWPLIIAIPIAFVVAGFTGVITDGLMIRRLRPTGPLVAAIGTIALGILLENVLRFIFGNEFRVYDIPPVRDWTFGQLHIPPHQVSNAIYAAIIMTILFSFLMFTRVGKMMRAVADNPALASLKGINTRRATQLATFVGMGLAGVGGVLVGLDVAIDPMIGTRIMLAVFAAAVVGGLGSIPGAVVGAFIVGIGEEMALFFVQPTYRTAVGFLAIILILSFRPRGLLGEARY
jgi:branched-chain amino acid transport system permease protein/neutral amino acid transport system permease protein